MRNLKKALVLVLTLAMMLSVMVMGAGAVFTDQSSIDSKHQEAVDACVSLNIIQGMPDGSFDPAGNVTREQMTKMVCVLLNGGNDPVLGTANVVFDDVSNDRWSAPYIQSCVKQGIVAGVGSNKFDPTGNVTGAQAAKMLLVALGYNADIEEYTGPNWAVNVNVDASAKGFYEGLSDIDPNAPLSREHSAQMIWNALCANEVEYKNTLSTDSNGQLTSKTTVQDKVVGSTNDKISLLEDKYDVKSINGTLTSVQKDNGKSTYNIGLTNATYNGTPYKTGNVGWSDVTTDYSALKYEQVRVLVKEDNNGKDAVVFGVYPTGKNTVQTAILKNTKMDDGRVKMNGTKYDLDTTAKQSVYLNGSLLYENAAGNAFSKTQDATYTTKATIAHWLTVYGDASGTKYTDKAYTQPTAVQLVANDGTSNYSILKVITYDVGKVTGVGSDYVNVSWKYGDTSFTSAKCTDTDWNWYDGIAKNDYVLATAGGNYADGKGVLEKASVVNGKITATKSGDSVSLDGTWYTMAGKGAAQVKMPKSGATVTMVEVDGYVFYTTVTAGNIDDVALLVAAAPTGGTGNKWEGRMIMADGSDKTVTIEKYWDDKDNKSFPITQFKEGNNPNPNFTSYVPGAYDAAGSAPMLVTFSVSGDVYTLSRLGVDEISSNSMTPSGDFAINGYDYYVTAAAGGTAKTDGSVKNVTSNFYDKAATAGAGAGTITGATTAATASKLYYEDTGAVFVKYKASATGADADYKVVTGKTAAGYDRALKGAGVMGLADASGNNYYMQVGMIDLGTGSAGGSGDKYAVILSDVVKDTSNGTKYIITAWDGSNEITITTDDSAVSGKGGGTLIAYSGDVNNATVSVKSAKNHFVKSYDEGSGEIVLMDVTRSATTPYTYTETAVTSTYNVNKIKKDTVVMYVSSDDGAGFTSGEIERAFYYNADFWTGGAIGSGNLTEDFAPNVTCFFDDSDYITVMVVDVNRNITEW